jgi:glycosyltransferase involved in cell wall biosynthesis
MSAALRVGLIINTFEQPEYLRRVLQAVSSQTLPADEVLLADDGSGEATRRAFSTWQNERARPAQHVWQKHEGFRRARILNEAIVRAQSDILIFLDGDTIPHPEFVADHRRLAREGFFIQGHRALLKKRGAEWFGLNGFQTDRRRAFWTGQFESLKNIWRWPHPWLRIRADLRGIRGCNLCIWRNDLERVNGYNEAFEGWGREDSELAVRLMNLGVKRRDVRGWALCYHLWHPPANRDALPENDNLLADAQSRRALRCEAGLDRVRSAH